MDGSELKRCSAGIFNVGKLNRQGPAVIDDFSFEEFLAKNEEWGKPDPRPEVEYPISYDIQSDDVTGELSKFSVNKLIADGRHRNLQESIREYMLNADSVKHMFCTYSKTDPQKFYTQAVLVMTTKMAGKPRRLFPIVLIVTNSDKMASIACRNLETSKQKNGYSSKIKIRNLVNNLPEGPRLYGNNRRSVIDIAVGSAAHIVKYIAKLNLDREDDMLKLAVKHVVVLGTESLATDKPFYEAFRQISAFFKFSPTTFIFLHDNSDSRCTPVQAYKTCSRLVRGSMFFEVQKQNTQAIFDRVEFVPVVPTEEFVDGLVAQRSEEGAEIYDNMFAAAKITMTPQVQKLGYCVEMIDNLRSERQKSNQQNHKSRKERILIVAGSTRTALLLFLFLKRRKQESKFGLQDYKVAGLFEGDSFETVENRNFEFRWGSLEVLVIDWKSIQAVNRGTVDAVIFFDSPPEQYFQTVLELEVQCLVSRNCVKIKLYILFDQEADIMLLVKYAKFIEKYNKRAPQWFLSLYDKYLKRWHEIHHTEGSTESFESVLLIRNIL